MRYTLPAGVELSKRTQLWGNVPAPYEASTELVGMFPKKLFEKRLYEEGP